ncbi:oligosaccharide flippase family protein [Candidatus Woesearchaeota archaeon]|nr:oligosaccharide flippase family protein [Candidatus Woesearchaeota archaeon]
MSHARNSAYIVAAQLSLLFSGAVVNFGIGRLLGPSLYGQFGVVYAVATIVNVLLTPGMAQAVSRFVASDRGSSSSIAGSLLRSQLLVGLALGVVYFILVSFISVLLNGASLSLLLRIIAPLFVTYSLAAVYGGYLAGVGRFGAQAVQLLIYSCSRLFLTFVLAYFFSVAGAVVALPLSAFAALSYFAFASRLKFSSFKVLPVYRFAFPMALFAGMVTLLMSVDLFSVKALLNDSSLAGYYTAASAVARIPYFILTALGIVLLPVVAGKLASREDASVFVRSAFRYVVILLLPSSFLIAATSKPLVMLLYRSEYAAASLPLSVLSLSTIALTLAYLFAVVVSASGAPFVSAAVASVMVVLSAVLNLFLVPRYFLLGASFATAVVSFVFLAVIFVFAFRRVGNPFGFSSVKVLFASLIVFFIAVRIDFGDKFLLPLVYLALVLLYFLLLFLMREFRQDDFRHLFSLVPSRLRREFL